MTPPEGYDESIEEDIEYENIQFGVHSIDKLIDILG